MVSHPDNAINNHTLIMGALYVSRWRGAPPCVPPCFNSPSRLFLRPKCDNLSSFICALPRIFFSSEITAETVDNRGGTSQRRRLVPHLVAVLNSSG